LVLVPLVRPCRARRFGRGVVDDLCAIGARELVAAACPRLHGPANNGDDFGFLRAGQRLSPRPDGHRDIRRHLAPFYPRDILAAGNDLRRGLAVLENDAPKNGSFPPICSWLP